MILDASQMEEAMAELFWLSEEQWQAIGACRKLSKPEKIVSEQGVTMPAHRLLSPSDEVGEEV